MEDEQRPGFSGPNAGNNGNGTGYPPQQNHTVSTPPFSPLTPPRGENSGPNESGAFGVVEAAVGVARAQIVQIVRSEMRDAVVEAVRSAMTGSTVPLNNPTNTREPNWPRELPPASNSTRNEQLNAGAPRNNDLPPPYGNDPPITTETHARSGILHRYRPRYPELHKWGLKYDGTTRTMMVEDFIFRVEKLQRSYECPWSVIMDGFHQLLEGQAERWYWDHIRDRPGINWQNMKLDIVLKFQQFHSNMDVIRRIMDRVQLRDEKSSSFIDAIVSLRNQLREPMPDHQLVDIMKKNLRPRLASLVFATQIYSVEHFRGECRKAEDLVEHEFQQRSRQNMPARAVNELSWDDNGTSEVAVEEIRHRSFPRSYRPIQNLDSLECYNCHEMGHTHKYCLVVPRRLFCYRCGAPGVVTPKCVRCNPGNRNPSANSGESRSTQTID